jgi:hypothetical protein
LLSWMLVINSHSAVEKLANDGIEMRRGSRGGRQTAELLTNDVHKMRRKPGGGQTGDEFSKCTVKLWQKVARPQNLWLEHFQ